MDRAFQVLGDYDCSYNIDDNFDRFFRFSFYLYKSSSSIINTLSFIHFSVVIIIIIYLFTSHINNNLIRFRECWFVDLSADGCPTQRNVSGTAYMLI